ncbi:hypothetical protein PYW08_007125 [Mythimna loreyi]|uniref:Uncharacterized protein n=1 Tax=Mythimna loreyi TaxID=667449 RepID=A0ACC2R8S6_9NEOP|nr:hypothetical protein PYW08_007125 [Mythimna loreyi]
MSDKYGANKNKPKRLTTPRPNSDHEMRSSRNHATVPGVVASVAAATAVVAAETLTVILDAERRAVEVANPIVIGLIVEVIARQIADCVTRSGNCQKPGSG